MPTNDERHKIATKLRESREFIRSMPKVLLEQNAFDAFERILACVDYERGNIFDYLADLIEPEPERTCKDERYQWCMFECSECGCECEGGDYEGHNCSTGAFNYCPNCGARVVKE